MLVPLRRTTVSFYTAGMTSIKSAAWAVASGAAFVALSLSFLWSIYLG